MKRQVLDKNAWLQLRPQLNNSYDYNQEWELVVDSFCSRINDFYFTPISKVKDPNKLKGEGFTILTIQCALIEMFAAFKVGKIHNHKKKTTDPLYEYRLADECFIPFLQNEKIFEGHFYTVVNNQKTINVPYNANDFYNKVRCGLMHEARTKGEWHINAKKEYLGNEVIFITSDTSGNKISVDRTILDKQLNLYFKEYINALKEKTPDGNSLRRLFARKLDHMHDIPRDEINYDWWIDL